MRLDVQRKLQSENQIMAKICSQNGPLLQAQQEREYIFFSVDKERSFDFQTQNTGPLEQRHCGRLKASCIDADKMAVPLS